MQIITTALNNTERHSVSKEHTPEYASKVSGGGNVFETVSRMIYMTNFNR